MTLGCYRRRERSCVFAEGASEPRLCIHCDCPESERSQFHPEIGDVLAQSQRVRKFLARRHA